MSEIKIPNMDKNFLTFTEKDERFYLRTAREEYVFSKEQILFFIGIMTHLFNGVSVMEK